MPSGESNPRLVHADCHAQASSFWRFPPSASRNGVNHHIPAGGFPLTRPASGAAYAMLEPMRTGPWLPGPRPSVVDRPHLPGYGIESLDAGGGPLPWSWAVERIERARNYWVATASPAGVPHLAAVWGVWLGGALYFSTGGESVKAHNLAASARCVVTPENANEAVIVHGVAERVGDPTAVDFVRRSYVDKYGEGFPDPAENPLFAVAPRVVLGLISGPDFTTRATRWHFTSIDSG